ncbi:MAG: hypothetical protein LBR61_03605 [Synergistaceae bacterium]|jgi:hypothetical protein|nr:hypothetical protein [Synergistaceae bacterium]
MKKVALICAVGLILSFAGVAAADTFGGEGSGNDHYTEFYYHRSVPAQSDGYSAYVSAYGSVSHQQQPVERVYLPAPVYVSAPVYVHLPKAVQVPQRVYVLDDGVRYYAGAAPKPAPVTTTATATATATTVTTTTTSNTVPAPQQPRPAEPYSSAEQPTRQYFYYSR